MPQKVNFRWAVNTSKGLSDFDASHFTSKGSSSLLSYRPFSYTAIHNYKDNEASDEQPAIPTFGVVYCWAHNKIGWQKNPCTFTVRPAGNLFTFCELLTDTHMHTPTHTHTLQTNIYIYYYIYIRVKYGKLIFSCPHDLVSQLRSISRN